MHKQSKALKYSLDVAPKIGLITQTWFSANFCNHAPQATRNETNVSLAISSAVQPHHVYIIVHMNLTGELLSPSVIHLPAKFPGGCFNFTLSICWLKNKESRERNRPIVSRSLLPIPLPHHPCAFLRPYGYFRSMSSSLIIARELGTRGRINHHFIVPILDFLSLTMEYVFACVRFLALLIWYLCE